jgi:hypothetical protein
MLRLALDKILGSSSIGISEIATGGGRGLIAFENTVGLANTLHLLPYESFTDRYPLFDFVSTFLVQHHQMKSVSYEHWGIFLEELQRLLRLVGSNSFSAGGAFEALIEERSRQLQLKQAKQAVQRARTHNAKYIEGPFDSLEGVATAITQLFESSTNTELALKLMDRTDKDLYTRLEFVMSFHPGEEPEDLPASDRVLELVDSLATLVASEKGLKRADIYSVTNQPYLLENAILFIVKINWKHYEGDEEIRSWET